MRRGAFTLLETLLAISLTVSVGIAALALTTAQARIAAAAHAQEESLALVTETVRLLDDDLVLAVKQPGYGRFRIVESGGLRLLTSSRLPGEAAGLHEVEWRYDTVNARVLRTSSPRDGGAATTRAVGHGWKAFAIASERDDLWVEAVIGASPERWRLPLWTEAP